MIIRCINLPANPDFPHREERRSSAARQIELQGHQIEFWNGIHSNPSYKGIIKAHQQIIKFAKDSDMPEITIMEDDAMFTDPGGLDFYLSNKPEKFDLYLGGLYAGQLQDNRIMNGFSGLTLYTISQQFYDDALGVRTDWHFDRAMGEMSFRKLFYVCSPFVVYQSSGFSDNQRRKMNYDGIHANWEYYKSRPPLAVST